MARIDLPPGNDDELIRLYMVNPTMGVAAAKFSDAVYNTSALPTREREAARIRIAEINGCDVCLSTRTTSTPEQLTEAEYLGMADWKSLASLSPREALAAEFAERFALDHRNLDDDFWVRLRANYDDAEIFDLATCIAGWLALGRITQIFDAGVSCPLEL